MEQWASNTLRVLGIVVTAIVVVLCGLALLLISMCAWGGAFRGSEANTAFAYMAGLAVVVGGGIFIIARLAKGIVQSAAGQDGAAGTLNSQPMEDAVAGHLSPASRDVLRWLRYAIVAGLVLNAIHIFWNLSVSTGTFLLRTDRVVMGTILSFLLYQAPYAVLLVALARNPGRRVLSYALAIPFVLTIQILYTLPFSIAVYRRVPFTFVFLGVGFAVDCLVLGLAFRANQRLGYRHSAGSLLVAGLVVLIYFSGVLHILVPWRIAFCRR